jgi:hypothetical protein
MVRYCDGEWTGHDSQNATATGLLDRTLHASDAIDRFEHHFDYRGKTMSRSAFVNCDNERARSRFWVWSIAIASSLTSTGLVYIGPATAWAQEQAATENAQVQTSERSQESETERNGENELAKNFDRTAFNALVRKGQLKQAA